MRTNELVAPWRRQDWPTVLWRMSQEKTERYKLHGNQEYCEHETISHIQWPHGWSARHFGDYFGPPGLQNLHMQTQRLPDNAHEERVTHARSISIVLAHSITKNRFTNDQNELAKPKIGSIYVPLCKRTTWWWCEVAHIASEIFRCRFLFFLLLVCWWWTTYTNAIWSTSSPIHESISYACYK